MIDPLSIISKYYSEDSDAYQILVLHSQQVRDKALAIAKQHPEFDIDVTFLGEAAMLHDIGVIQCNAPDIDCYGSHAYIEHGYLGAQMLRKEGLEKHALVCERHTGVGLSAATILRNKLPLPASDMLPISLEEKIICYADKFFSKSSLDRIHSLEYIRKDLKKYGEEELATFDSWHLLFGELASDR